MGGLTESKRRTCRRNHCPPSDVWRAWLPSAHPCARSHIGAGVRRIGWNAVATPELTRLRITMVIRSRCPPKEQCGQVERLSGELYAACQLSLTLGCETGRCLQAVAESLKRQRLLDDLRTNAFAMPKATMKLLMALPLLTVLLGEGMGAHSLAFLVSGVKGLACLGFALCCYTFGLIWIRALMRQDDMKGAM